MMDDLNCNWKEKMVTLTTQHFLDLRLMPRIHSSAVTWKYAIEQSKFIFYKRIQDYVLIHVFANTVLQK